MVVSCIRYVMSLVILLICGIIFCNQIEYCFDERLSVETQEDIKKNIQECIAQKQNIASLVKTIPTRYPCIQSTIIEHLPENKELVNIVSVQPHIVITIGKNTYVIDTLGNSLSTDYFRQEQLDTLAIAYAAQQDILEHWDARIAQAILYFATTHPDSRIEIDNAHSIRVQPKERANLAIISDAYQLPTPEQLALCAHQMEQHARLPTTHLKKCKQLTFDTRFKQQIIQRCTGIPGLTGVKIGGIGHGSHTT